MAAPFVPVPFPVDWTEERRSWTKTGSPIHTSISWVRGVGPSDAAAGAPTLDDSWTRPRVGMLDGPKDEGSLGDSWVERPITPTLLDYEILEERAKFTVYKILVTGSQGDSWVIFRRYTDFCRLNDKLKELFPSFALALPPKRWFKDNYDEEFLEERQIGLQTFLQNLTLHVDITSSEAVRHFLRLVDPPSPFDSLEESRAFCETLEETNHRLQRELQENQREVDTLKKTLEEKENHMSFLVNKVKSPSLSSESFEGPCRLTATIATDTSTHREGDTDANGFNQKDTDGNEGVDDERRYSVTEADKESNHGTR